jgi:methylmalonyl-CoA mutase N-terminal domain/subunit
MSDKLNQQVKRHSTGNEVKPIYTPKDLPEFNYDKDLGDPGQYPYTRGLFPNGYREKLWTKRLYAGFSTSEDTNKRFKFLLENGNTGLSMALDLPTQLGLDSDDPKAKYDVGKVGVAIDTLEDMENIFDGIPLDQISTSFTINATAPIILAMYIATAEKQGVPSEKVRGTVQNDLLKEFIARGNWIFPPKESVHLIGDVIEYCVENSPKFNPISISGTHIAECRANSAQTIAFPMLNGMCYIDEMIERGYSIDQFGPMLTFHLPAGGLEYYGFFEIIAKFRAGRRLWASLMKDKYHASNPKAMWFKFSTGVGGSGLTAQQPKNNIARLSYYALAAVLGGTRSLNLASYDEALALPSEEAARTSLMIQHVLALETCIPDTVDPLGGSYYVESLTNEIEGEILKVFKEIEQQGGMLNAITMGYVQRLLSRQAYEFESKVQNGDYPIVGVNKFVIDEEQDIEIYEMDPKTYERQLKRLNEIRQKRNKEDVVNTLKALEAAAIKKKNVMPFIIDAVKAYCTVGEICSILKKIYGEFKEPVSI